MEKKKTEQLLNRMLPRYICTNLSHFQFATVPSPINFNEDFHRFWEYLISPKRMIQFSGRKAETRNAYRDHHRGFQRSHHILLRHRRIYHDISLFDALSSGGSFKRLVQLFRPRHQRVQRVQGKPLNISTTSTLQQVISKIQSEVIDLLRNYCNS